MEYNLLQEYYDKQCELFLEGYINYSIFESLENEYNFRKQLFTINLN